MPMFVHAKDSMFHVETSMGVSPKAWFLCILNLQIVAIWPKCPKPKCYTIESESFRNVQNILQDGQITCSVTGMTSPSGHSDEGASQWNMSHRCSIGFKSFDRAGHSMIWIPLCFRDAMATRELSCIRMKSGPTETAKGLTIGLGTLARYLSCQSAPVNDLQLRTSVQTNADHEKWRKNHILA